jgi:ABC-type multidrug transport system ATPase subunit
MTGPNGSGKSTTVNMLCGYFAPTSGTAIVAGLDIRHDVDLVHLLLGVCPQDNIIWEDLTGAEHLRFYGRLKNLSGDKLAAEVKYRLQQVDLWSVHNKKAGQYSGGMKRRLCVAIALIGTPRVILMDEPTTGS